MSVITFLVYARDKSAAKNKQWRTSESTLHLLALAGGWLGALIAQKAIRHKSIKADFQFMFFITMIMNLLGLAWLHTDAGMKLLVVLLSLK